MIQYPSHKSEADVRCELYHQLKLAGIDACAEVVERNDVKKHFKGMKGYRQCSFDMVIYKEKRAVCIIEIKKHADKSTARQSIKYSIYNIPLVFLIGMEGISECVEKVKSFAT